MSNTHIGRPVAAGEDTLNNMDRDFLLDMLRQRSAIEMNATKTYLLTTRLPPVVKRLGLSSLAAMVNRLREGDQAIERAFVDAMTTNETSFYRDDGAFQELSEHVLPPLISGLRPEETLNVWSAASSSGQEVYTFAIELLESFPDLAINGRVRIFASDLSPTMVERVRQGIYSDLEIRRGLPERLRNRYFERVDEGWRVSPTLRKLVVAGELNLTSSFAELPRCHIVLIRNVLIYFSDATRTSILERIRNEVLNSSGILLLGRSETLVGMDLGLDRVELPSGDCYRPSVDHPSVKPGAGVGHRVGS